MTWMNPMVEFCISNLANGSQATYEVLERDPNIDVLEYGCLSYCTKCSESFYAIVNGELVEADSPEALTKAIYQFIEENPLW
ncbi:hypothetical protein P799_22350 [Lysinibacillus sphaericus CBAM5]|uniref:Uncharacterized protein n=4 Tax=Lysinibacillus TaxID=400634 RepID=W7RJK2_LYSSH|nr:UPF0349 protein [Lysinibacillus sphaericus C3-41]EWH30619.1 hypothetical protein P799_24800 [Lysinibacillus sphaericus CBAM5]EWH30871.1 hypothetical protein P799_22350 [Lysinibacillus sphaericus CBAM5]